MMGWFKRVSQSLHKARLAYSRLPYVTEHLDLEQDEYPKWQMLRGKKSGWVGYDNGGFVPEILNTIPKKVYLDTKAGHQMIWYYLPEGSYKAYVLPFNVHNANPDNWTDMGDGRMGMHPNAVYLVNRSALLGIVKRTIKSVK